MSAEDIVADIEKKLEYGRQDSLEIVEELPYEQFWDELDNAREYANKRLTETNWQQRFNTREEAVRHYIITEQRREERPSKPEGTKSPTSPF